MNDSSFWIHSEIVIFLYVTQTVYFLKWTQRIILIRIAHSDSGKDYGISDGREGRLPKHEPMS